MESAITSLDINRPQWEPCTLSGLPLQDTESLKEKLLGELVMLEKRAGELQDGGNTYDFSLLQTCKEMIHSRRLLFNQLNR